MWNSRPETNVYTWYYLRFWKMLASFFFHPVLMAITLVCSAMEHVEVVKVSLCTALIKFKALLLGFAKVSSKKLQIIKMTLHLGQK